MFQGASGLTKCMLAVIFILILVLPFLMKTKLSLAHKVILPDSYMVSVNFLNSGVGPLHSGAKLVEPQL
jgi:hypothetical protein